MAAKAATYSGAEYIIIQDSNSESTGASLLPKDRLAQIVSERNCRTVDVDGIARYIILSDDIDASLNGRI